MSQIIDFKRYGYIWIKSLTFADLWLRVNSTRRKMGHCAFRLAVVAPQAAKRSYSGVRAIGGRAGLLSCFPGLADRGLRIGG